MSGKESRRRLDRALPDRVEDAQLLLAVGDLAVGAPSEVDDKVTVDEETAVVLVARAVGVVCVHGPLRDQC